MIECDECDESYGIAWLMTGFSTPTLATPTLATPTLAREGAAEEILREVRAVKGYLANTANQVRTILNLVSIEVPDCPRLFTLGSAGSGRKKGRFWQQDQYELTLWCEHPGHEHPWPEATYKVTRLKDWLIEVAPYLRLVVKTLHLVAPIASAVTGVVLSEDQLKKGAEHQIKLMETLLEKVPEPRGHKDLTDIKGNHSAGVRPHHAG